MTDHTTLPAGTEVPVTINYLVMEHRPAYDRPSAPLGPAAALIRAEAPPPWYFLALYGAVGRDWEWNAWFARTEEEITAFITDPDVHLYTFMRGGWPAGFFILDHRETGVADLAYFGLVPQAIGAGLGGYLVRTAIHMAWDHPGVEKMTVETCTLDHPSALGLYQRCGFAPAGQSQETHILARPRAMPAHA